MTGLTLRFAAGARAEGGGGADGGRGLPWTAAGLGCIRLRRPGPTPTPCPPPTLRRRPTLPRRRRRRPCPRPRSLPPPPRCVSARDSCCHFMRWGGHGAMPRWCGMQPDDADRRSGGRRDAGLSLDRIPWLTVDAHARGCKSGARFQAPPPPLSDVPLLLQCPLSQAGRMLSLRRGAVESSPWLVFVFLRLPACLPAACVRSHAGARVRLCCELGCVGADMSSARGCATPRTWATSGSRRFSACAASATCSSELVPSFYYYI